MDKTVSSLRVTYKKLEKEKMAVILALRFLTSSELLLRTEIIQKNSKLYDLRTKLSSSKQTIRDQGSKLSVKDGQLASKDQEISSKD